MLMKDHRAHVAHSKDAGMNRTRMGVLLTLCMTPLSFTQAEDRAGWSLNPFARRKPAVASEAAETADSKSADAKTSSSWKLFGKSSSPVTVAVPKKPQAPVKSPATTAARPAKDSPVPSSATRTSKPAAVEQTESVIVPVSAQAEAAVPPAPNETAPAGTEAAKPYEEMLASQEAMSLVGVIALADQYHPKLTASYQAVQATRGRAVQAGLYPNPILSTSSPQMAGKDSQYNVFASQDLVTAHKLKLDVAAIAREVQQAEFAWQQTRFGIVTEIRQQFFVTLAAQNRVATWQSLVQIASRSKDVAEKLLMAGEGTRSDTLLFGIEVDRAEVGLANATTIYDVGRRQLSILCGLPDLEIARLEGDLETPLPEYDLQSLRFEVGQMNAAANIARTEVDRQGVKLQRAIVEPIPNINVMGGYQRQVTGPYENQGLFQVSVEVPLWDKNQGNIFATQAHLAGARADVQRVELELANQAAQSLSTYRAASQLVTKYEEQILPKARETLQISQQLYAQGQIDFLRLLQAQKTLLEAELARIDAQQQRWVAAATIAGLRQDEAFP